MMPKLWRWMMARGIVVLLLIIIATLLIFEMCGGNIGAQEKRGGFGQVLENQKLILDKLEAMDQKLDVIKMRIRQ